MTRSNDSFASLRFEAAVRASQPAPASGEDRSAGSAGPVLYRYGDASAEYDGSTMCGLQRPGGGRQPWGAASCGKSYRLMCGAPAGKMTYTASSSRTSTGFARFARVMTLLRIKHHRHR